MGWEQRLLAVFEDLEQQAEGLALAERDTAALELGRAAYSEVLLSDRVHASLGLPVLFELVGSGTATGRLVRAGEGWCLVEDTSAAWVVRLDAVTSAAGLSDRALAAGYRPFTARLGLGSVLRSLADQLPELTVLTAAGPRSGRVRRVGADFLELSTGARDGDPGRPVMVPFAHVAAVRTAAG